MKIADNRMVLVTGGASGFGLATARRLADSGAGVVIADSSKENLRRAVSIDSRLVPMELDVRDAAAVRRVVAKGVERLGGLDTLICCAGVVHVKPLEEVDEADWDLTLDVNLKGAFLVSQAAAPALRSSGRGRIVAVASDAAHRGYPWIQAYCASKFGLVGLCESLAVELATDNVTVNCVCPAAVPTTGMGRDLLAWKAQSTGKSEEEVLASITSVYPLGRCATEDDVTSAILYFISDAGSFLTGIALDIDGGVGLGFLPGIAN